MFYKNVDLECKAKYKCPKCGCPVFKAEDENGRRIFVHRTCNSYADHAKNCPNRKPDIKPEEDELFKENIIITKPETVEVSAEQFKKYEEPKTTPKKAGKKKGIKSKKDGTEKRDREKNKRGKKPLPANKRTATRRSKNT